MIGGLWWRCSYFSNGQMLVWKNCFRSVHTVCSWLWTLYVHLIVWVWTRVHRKGISLQPPNSAWSVKKLSKLTSIILVSGKGTSLVLISLVLISLVLILVQFGVISYTLCVNYWTELLLFKSFKKFFLGPTLLGHSVMIFLKDLFVY